MYFIPGLLLNPIWWAIWKGGKGQICINCANGPDSADIMSSANTFIPRPKAGDLDACLPVYYACLSCATSITFPIANILQHWDDIDAVFCRVLYIPVLAIVNCLYLCLSRFSSHSSRPSLWLAIGPFIFQAPIQHSGFGGNMRGPDNWSSHAPPWGSGQPQPQNLAPAIADEYNLPMLALECAFHSNCCFVDDNGILVLWSNIKIVLHNSIVVAFLLFGWLHKDHRSSCQAPDKWERDLHFDMLYLGFRICSRTLTVTWPF
jgi:hypothetical protein